MKKATPKQIKLLRGVLFEKIHALRVGAGIYESIEQTESFLKEYAGIEYTSKSELSFDEINTIIEWSLQYAMVDFGIDLDPDERIKLDFERS